MRRLHHVLTAALLITAVPVVGIGAPDPARADTLICDQYGSTTIANGRYVVQNNRWGASTEQCVNVTSTGFSIVTANHNNPTNGAPAAYPSIYLGCHYDNCTTGSNLPAQVGRLSRVPSSITYQYPGSGTYNASYDIWLDPTPRTTGQNATEIMIWFNRQGSIQPIGSPVGTQTIGGRTWEVWTGNPGWNVVSYVAPAPITAWSFDVLDFVRDVRARGAVTDSWYLTSVQAGFEPWIGGAGLAVSSFSAAVETGDGGGGGSACRVAYTPTNVWNNGFTADVTVTNTGSSPVNGWTLTYDLPTGQQLTGWWSATETQSGQRVTARNVEWNAGIAPGASVTFGHQATYVGGYASPTGFTLNGTACARA